jgi:hypothetical protein
MKNAIRLACLALLLWPTSLSLTLAQEPESPAKDTSPVQERDIYIPFSKLQDVFEKEGRGVFLPYDQFQKLWDAAQEREEAPPQEESPVDAIITSAINEATVKRDVIEVEATLSIELLKQGWLQVPLRLNDAAIQSATIDGEVARVTPTPEGGYQLLIENKSDKPSSIELQLVYSRAFTKSPGRNSVTFNSPQAPVNRWRIRIPQAGVKVNVQPMIAASEVPVDDASDDRAPSPAPNPDETLLLAFVGAAPQVLIDWTPKSEGARGMTALTSVQVAQSLSIAEGTVRTRAELKYEISRGELEQLSVLVPQGHKVVNIFDANVRKWTIAEEGNNQRIMVELFEPAQTAQNLLVELEQFISIDDSLTITAPRIRVEEVGRQQGTIVVNVDPALKAEAITRSGLLQVDAAELPQEQAGQTRAFSYRYASLPFELAIGVEKIKPRISVVQLAEAYLLPDEWNLDLLAVYDVQDAGVFQLEFIVPEDFEVLQVSGCATGDATAAVVDSFRRQDDAPTRLIVNLSRKAIGKVSLQVKLQRRLSDANLITPTGSSSELSLNLPRASQTNISRAEGHFILHSPDSLRVNPSTTSGLRPISFSEAYRDIASIRDNRFPSARPAFAFAFSDQAAQFAVTVERRKSQITARQRMVVRLDNGVVRYETIIFYEILYSGVKSLRLDVPASVASEIRNTSETLREAPLNPTPDDVTEGYVAWGLTGEAELIGTQIVRLQWEQKLDQLDVGKSLEVAVPHLKPMSVDRAWGQIVIAKTETLDIQPSGELTGLRPIDPTQDIMKDALVANAARAFEFYDDWQLSLTATRFQLEELKRTSIERGLVRAVITRSDEQGIQAIYRMRSARQRLALQLPAEAQFDTQPVRINGQPVALERGDQGQLFVPLVGQEPDAPFLLELRYTVPGDHQSISVPTFPEDPAVQRVFLAIYLPEELALLGSTGPWSEEYRWRHKQSLKWIPQVNQSDSQLTKWVTEGINAPPSSAFQTAGTVYLFSALRPQPPPEGDLKLRVVQENWLAGFIFLPLALLAGVMIRSSLRSKIATIALVVIAILLTGVFTPTLAQQLLNAPLYAALAMVGIIWSASHLMHASRNVDWRKPLFDRKSPSSPDPAMATPVDTVPAGTVPAQSTDAPQANDNRGAQDE